MSMEDKEKRKLLDKVEEVQEIFNEAETGCQILCRMIKPYIDESISDDVECVFNESDGLVLVYKDTSRSIIEAIKKIDLFEEPLSEDNFFF